LPNIKSAKKRVKVNQTKALANRMAKSALKTSLKKAESAITDGDAQERKAALDSVQKDIDRAAARGLLHKNTAARSKSRLAKLANAQSKQDS
jgi:small subunit ribosomal protein S20